MVELGPPHGMIDFDPEDACLHFQGARVIRDLGPDGFIPGVDRGRFFQASLQSRVPGADLREDVLDGVEGHGVRPKYMILPTRAIRRALFPVFLAVLAGMSGCGYALENSRSNSLREVGVQRVYVSPVKNQSYKPGVENLFYNELIQSLLAGRRVHLVDRPELADAILESNVVKALYTPSATTPAKSIFPVTVTAIEIAVATEYQADVTCSFQLRRQKGGVGTDTLWESAFSRSRRFAGNNQKIEYGTTSGLINESEFDRTLKEVAHGMMQDVHQAMVARF